MCVRDRRLQRIVQFAQHHTRVLVLSAHPMGKTSPLGRHSWMRASDTRSVDSQRVEPAVMPAGGSRTGSFVRWLRQRDWSLWLLFGIMLLALIPRLYGLNWDANNHLHPDEREIVFRSICLTFPDTPRPGGCDPSVSGPGWFFSPASPLNPHFFAYGSFPLYLLAAVAHGLSWITTLTHGQFVPPDGGVWSDFNHFTLIGRVLSALFDVGSVLLAGLLARKLGGRIAGLLAAAFVAVTPFEVQVSHFYAVDTLLLFFVLLTLLGSVYLAGRQWEGLRIPALWSTWLVGTATGVAFGLALATKVSALPLAAPIAVALILRWRRRGPDEAILALLSILAAALVTFLVTSPYAIIDFHTFQQQVSEQTALARGQLDYPYVRQFAGTTPYIYEIRQLLLYDMGLPLGLLGIAGAIWAVTRVWRNPDSMWTIMLTWLVVYFGIVGGSYTKFTRYMLPVFAPLAICGTVAIVVFARWGTRLIARTEAGEAEPRGRWDIPARLAMSVPVKRLTALWGTGWWRAVCVTLALIVLGISTLFTLALVNIYSTPNTRVQASEWIYNHVPAGSLLTNEVWDDPLPIQVPPARVAHGVSYTSAGHIIDPGQYPEIGLNLYDDDTPQKAQQLAQQLFEANAVVISSQRLVKSIPKFPDRYPMTIRYYDLLFAGKLGFKLEAHFTNEPHFAGFTLNDSGADESFSVYDHPPVWIFVKSGPALSMQQINTLLTEGLNLPAASTRSGNQKSLLLPATNALANAQSQAIGIQFPSGSLANRVPLVWWLLIIELIGLFSFPLAYVALPGLRDRGWGLSKTLGIVLIGYVTWLPASLRLLPFDHWVVVGAFVALGLVGGAVAWRRRDELRAFVRARWKLLLACELAFLVAFLFFTWVRALDPDLWHIYRGGEKPMEFSYLNAILRSRYMPPYDPWFAGGYINYYYYGFYLAAALIKLTGVTPAVAFNLLIPLFFGLTFSAAFSIVAGLVGRWWAGIAGGVAVVVIGNLDGLWQLIGQWRALVAGLPIPPFDYWRSSRVIPCEFVSNPNCAQTTINEFPYWSFLYADFHPHLIDLPIVLLLIGVSASLVVVARRRMASWRSVLPSLAVATLAMGTIWVTNTWDLPAYGILFAVALAVWVIWRRWIAPGVRLSELDWWPLARNYAVTLGACGLGAYLLFAPFHANFQAEVSGIGAVTTPTDPNQFATVFGIWLFLAASYLVIGVRDRIGRLALLGTVDPEDTPARDRIVLVASVVVLIAAYVAGVKVLMLLFIITGITLLWDRENPPVRIVTYLLIVLAAAIAFGVEIIYIRDFLDGTPWERMNTVFKFYYQVWVLLSLGGALAAAQIVPRLFAFRQAGSESLEQPAVPQPGEMAWERDEKALSWQYRLSPSGFLRGVWIGALLALLFGSSIFLVEGTSTRVNDPSVWAAVQPPPAGVQPDGLSLDGMAFMRGWYPGDYQAINWLNTHVSGTPTIVEASTGVYHWHGRVSIYTGLPTVVELGHELEQRYGQEVETRQADVQQFWSTDSADTAAHFLSEYHVRYVYLGQLERTCYVTATSPQGYDTCVPMSVPAIEKFRTLTHQGILRTVYQQNGVTIYEVIGS